jgi:hypothetical protein
MPMETKKKKGPKLITFFEAEILVCSGIIVVERHEDLKEQQK